MRARLAVLLVFTFCTTVQAEELLLKGRARDPQPLYPIAKAVGAAEPEAREEILAEAAKVLDSEQAKAIAARLAQTKIMRVACKAVLADPFTEQKKQSGDFEFLHPWKSIYSVALPSIGKGARCFRAFSQGEVGSGFAVYAVRLRSRMTIVGVWIVPEVI
jgi:hypothetical protein